MSAGATESAADPSGLQAAIREGHVDAGSSLDSGVKGDLLSDLSMAMDVAEARADPEEVEKAVLGYVAGRQSTNE